MDLAFYRASNQYWYIRDVFNYTPYAMTPWGTATDILIPARDTNGDGDPYQ